MDGTYYHHQGVMFPPMFPQVFPPPPPPPPAPATQSVVPAKREDDDVQFVSSNPVKKRRLDTYRPIMPPPTIPTITHSPPPADNQPVPAPNHQPPEPPKHAAVTAVQSQPERRGSTGMVDPSSTSHAMDIDPTRGCSVPIPERSQYLESFWTAPSSGPQCSPPVSPKTLPEHVQPSMLRLDEHHGPAPGPTNGLSGGGGGAVVNSAGFPRSAHPTNSPARMGSQPPTVRAEGTPTQPNSEMQIPTETEKDTRTVDSILAGAVDFIPEPDAASMTDATNGQQQVSTGTHQLFPCWISREAKAQQRHQTRPQQHKCSLISTPTLTITLLTLVRSHLFPKFQLIPQRMLPPMARLKLALAAIVLRQEPKDLVGNVWRRAAMPSTANVPGAAQTSMPSSTIQQHWPHMLGINPYANPMAGAMYGPLLQQSMMAGPNSAFALPQQQYPHGMPAQQPAGDMLPMAPTSTQPAAPTYSSSQRNPYLQASSSTNTAKSAGPKATDPPQLTTKHIIVDIADTCLNVFPFEEVAKRHNQPEQKVRDIFGAVIQVPLLRCNTDKRRAGKLGTARVKEFNQAKKDAQAQVSANQSKQDVAMGQSPYMPSAWEMAQFMGPSDVRLGMFNNQFTGPW
ncbi:hypothetical protein GQ607_003595 [Colletotrichum asianum]|uniref:Uncharacterized protein n=1 Tax=Colletotrichum asianum TaxID=702518 RepID=A0A8H3WNV3_9PEZI|nr:hypothetical protein GQ607_003595 [Colletotrichum asianum]